MKNKLIVLSIFLLFASIANSLEKDNVGYHPRNQEAIDFVDKWLSYKEAGDSINSFDMVSKKYVSSLDTWKGNLNQEKDELGKLISRELIRAVAYQDPPSAPAPGLYIAVEYNSVYEKAKKHFQYIVVHSADGEGFKINNRRVNVLRIPPE